MYAITRINRGNRVIERRYTAEHINPVRKLLRKTFTQDNVLCALVSVLIAIVFASAI